MRAAVTLAVTLGLWVLSAVTGALLIALAQVVYVGIAAAQDDQPKTPAEVRVGPAVEPVPSVNGSAHLCDVAGAGASVKAGGFSVSVPTYPCEVARTYETLDEYADRSGFLAGSARFFLRVRLFTRGVFSSIFGLFGLG